MNHQLSRRAPVDDVEIRRAADCEARACRILMPEVFGPAHAPDLCVAIDRETDLLVGAGALSRRSGGSTPGFILQLHVPAPLRRRGIATALLAMIAETCRESALSLNSWFPVAQDSPAAAFMAASDFAVARRVFEFEAAAPVFYPRIRAIYDRLAQAGKLPANFQVVSLRDAPGGDVAALIAEDFQTASAAALTNVARGTGNHDPDRSVVLLDDGKVRGALLYSWNDGDPVIDAWIVAPEVRRSPASLIMVEAATRNGLDARAQRFRFSCAEDVQDTIKLAQRGGAVLTGTKINYCRTLPG